MSRLKLSVATTDYDHFRDFRLGAVQAEGIETTWSMLGHHEIFARFTFNREWDAAELSFAKFTAQVTRKNSDIIGLPVVCSRLFRFSSFYVIMSVIFAAIAGLLAAYLPSANERAAIYAGISAPVRTPRGRDIDAACGQLKTAAEKKRRSATVA